MDFIGLDWIGLGWVGLGLDWVRKPADPSIHDQPATTQNSLVPVVEAVLGQRVEPHHVAPQQVLLLAVGVHLIDVDMRQHADGGEAFGRGLGRRLVGWSVSWLVGRSVEVGTLNRPWAFLLQLLTALTTPPKKTQICARTRVDGRLEAALHSAAEAPDRLLVDRDKAAHPVLVLVETQGALGALGGDGCFEVVEILGCVRVAAAVEGPFRPLAARDALDKNRQAKCTHGEDRTCAEIVTTMPMRRAPVVRARSTIVSQRVRPSASTCSMS